MSVPATMTTAATAMAALAAAYADEDAAFAAALDAADKSRPHRSTSREAARAAAE